MVDSDADSVLQFACLAGGGHLSDASCKTCVCFVNGGCYSAQILGTEVLVCAVQAAWGGM